MKTTTIEVNEEDCVHILGWWTAATMMAQAGMRTAIDDKERGTINKISEAQRELKSSK